jgi:DNA-binding transcriptional regulator LsrR (DeoR family)
MGDVDQPRSHLQIDEEATLAARAAWLYFAGGQTQGEIAEKLNIPNTKAHRLIARASRDGLIRVFVEGPIAGCVALEEGIKAKFGLSLCEVVPNIDDGALPLRTLGMAGARYLRNVLDRAAHQIIGVGHGRTLAAAIDFLPSSPAPHVKFVSLLGGLTRRFAANPYDVIHRLSERTGSEAYLLPVPFFANSVQDKKVLLSQFGIADVVALAGQATLHLVGIGEVDNEGFITSAGMVAPAEIDDVARAGALGEVLGSFFADDGRRVPTDLSNRALAPDIEQLRGREMVAIAGGRNKMKAIRAVLRSGLLTGLITDEATARQLTGEVTGSDTGNKNGTKKAAD